MVQVLIKKTKQQIKEEVERLFKGEYDPPILCAICGKEIRGHWLEDVDFMETLYVLDPELGLIHEKHKLS